MNYYTWAIGLNWLNTIIWSRCLLNCAWIVLQISPSRTGTILHQLIYDTNHEFRWGGHIKHNIIWSGKAHPAVRHRGFSNKKKWFRPIGVSRGAAWRTFRNRFAHMHWWFKNRMFRISLKQLAKSNTRPLVTTQSALKSIWKAPMNARSTIFYFKGARVQLRNMSEEGIAILQPMTPSSWVPTYKCI